MKNRHNRQQSSRRPDQTTERELQAISILNGANELEQRLLSGMIQVELTRERNGSPRRQRPSGGETEDQTGAQ